MNPRHCQTWYTTKVDSTAVGESPSLRTKGTVRRYEVGRRNRNGKGRMTDDTRNVWNKKYCVYWRQSGTRVHKPGVRTVIGREKSNGRSRGSSVSVGTSPRAELPRNDWLFLLCTASRLALGPPEPPLQIRKLHRIRLSECNLVPEKLRRTTYVSASSYTWNVPYVHIHFTEAGRFSYQVSEFIVAKFRNLSEQIVVVEGTPILLGRCSKNQLFLHLHDHYLL